jgi:hypothetical protein
MRSNEIFAAMSAKEAAGFLAELKQDAPDVARLALGVTAEAFRLRPEFLKRQPRDKQAEWMRKALGRTIGAPLAEEILATYFLDHEIELLKELLDGFEVPHEDGRLDQSEPPSPDAKTLQSAVAKFRKGDRPEKRELLLRAFAAQSSVDWPGLEELLTTGQMTAPRAEQPAAKTKPELKPSAAPKPKPAARAKSKAKPAAKAKPKAKAKAKAKAKPKAKAKAKPKAKKAKRKK